MLSFAQAGEILSEEADSLPAEIYKELNGGIILLPDVKPSPHGRAGDLFILGEYHYDPLGLGRYITIYYGSICRVAAGLTRPEQKKKLREVLRHELIHHLESMAGDRSLERRDERELMDYYHSFEEGLSGNLGRRE